MRIWKWSTVRKMRMTRERLLCIRWLGKTTDKVVFKYHLDDVRERAMWTSRGKMSQAVCPLRGWDVKDGSSAFLLIIPGWTQTDIIINLWPNCSSGFMLMLFVLLCKTWNVVKPGAWLARPPPGSQQSQDFPHILPMVLQVLHSQ